MRTLVSGICLGLLGCLLATGTLSAGNIEAVKGKSYRLTKKHGPWMIMVASFHDVEDLDRKTTGMSASEAAGELVYELRRWGIPAYTFSQSALKGEVRTMDRSGREDLRKYAAQREMICVLAGNYSSIDDSIASKTLKQIKMFRPEFLSDRKSGAILREMPGKKGPLGGAFLTINPLIDPREIAQRVPDADLVELNSGIQYALVENPGLYTVQVATFTGRSVTPVGNSSLVNKEQEFDSRLKPSFDKVSGQMRSNLNNAGEDAAQLANELRHLQLPNIPTGVDAWVYHDRYQSIVTVGSFNNPNDPRIPQIMKNFGAKTVRDQSTGQDVLVGEVLMPSEQRKGRNSSQGWVFDPTPTLISVPRLTAKSSK